VRIDTAKSGTRKLYVLFNDILGILSLKKSGLALRKSGFLIRSSAKKCKVLKAAAGGV